jgi:tetratricopeptide (TPR) repeat protein
VSVPDLLELYDAGEFEMVRAAVTKASKGNLGVVHAYLKREGAAWIDADGPAHRPRRTLAAAVFALDVAEAALDRQWLDALDLLEWACERMRATRERSATERTFHLAALAVIQGARDPKALDWHIGHIQARFPDEPRIRLAQAFKAEIEYWRLYRGILGAVDGGDPDIVLPALRRAAERPENRREVALRTAFLFLQKGQHTVALEELAKVPPGDDPGQLYLACLMSGWAYEGQKKHDEAVHAYRKALSIVPRAQAATLHLGVLLYQKDQRAEADALVEEMLTADPAPVDPWRVFGYGDLRRFPALLETLRRAIE